MKRKMAILAGMVVVFLFLGGIFMAIIKLQGTPANHTKQIMTTPEATMAGEEMSNKIMETKNVEVAFNCGTGSSKVTVPLVLMEKTATGSLLSVKPDMNVVSDLVSNLPEPALEGSPKPAELENDSKGRPQRIKRGQTIVQIDREKTKAALISEVQKNPETSRISVPVLTREIEGESGFESLRTKAGFRICLGNHETINREHIQDAERNTNLRIAAEKIDGIILRPGEEFSFNRIVGERSRKNGFRMASVISNGKIIPGLGGGICQVSTTLYNVALMSNLKILERYNHSIYEGIPYAERGKDAAVVFGSKDFRFINRLDCPILITCVSGNGTVKVSLFAEKKPFDKVEVVTRNEIQIPFPVKQQNSRKAPKSGEKKIVRPGVTGYTLETFRVVTIGSTTKEEKLHRDNYLMFPQIEESN